MAVIQSRVVSADERKNDMPFKAPHGPWATLVASAERNEEMNRENAEARREYDNQAAREQAKDDADAKRKK
jgi:hypothetical protein